jgi:hypothetical protein
VPLKPCNVSLAFVLPEQDGRIGIAGALSTTESRIAVSSRFLSDNVHPPLHALLPLDRRWRATRRTSCQCASDDEAEASKHFAQTASVVLSDAHSGYPLHPRSVSLRREFAPAANSEVVFTDATSPLECCGIGTCQKCASVRVCQNTSTSTPDSCSRTKTSYTQRTVMADKWKGR